METFKMFLLMFWTTIHIENMLFQSLNEINKDKY